MELNKIFTSHMVFAAKKPIRIYGTGKGTAKITFAAYEKTVLSENDNWFIEFEPMEYGGPYKLEAEFPDRKITLEDIYVGEVFLFAGQSNMQFKMKESSTPEEEYRANSRLRLFSTDRIEKTDKFTSDDGWVVCDEKDIGDWSAIAYHTSYEVLMEKDVAIGVVVSYQGASVIESWVPEGTFEKYGINLPVEEKFVDHTCEEYSKWNGDGVLYNYSLSQVIPYALSAVVWYQGESDSSVAEGEVYCEELCGLIDRWRSDFCDASLLFVIVQLADTYHKMTDGWKLIQKAQQEIVNRRPLVKMAASADLCETNNIHPPTKDKLAKRIAGILNAEL